MRTREPVGAGQARGPAPPRPFPDDGAARLHRATARDCPYSIVQTAATGQPQALPRPSPS
ncbi:MAG TPA: hypothetical protein VFB60_17845 [Ktedonobacteraceae bacterium]|nr:hypothetical protein [Ktedonobacteraceae bacterium]